MESRDSKGAGPSLMFPARTSAKEATPALLVLQSWAPRTPISAIAPRDLPDIKRPPAPHSPARCRGNSPLMMMKCDLINQERDKGSCAQENNRENNCGRPESPGPRSSFSDVLNDVVQ